MILGIKSPKMIKCNLKNDILEDLEESNIEMQRSEEQFNYVHNGIKINDKIYLCGNTNMHIYECLTKQTKFIGRTGYWNAWVKLWTFKKQL